MKIKTVMTNNFGELIRDVVSLTQQGYSLVDRDGLGPYHMIAGAFTVNMEIDEVSASVKSDEVVDTPTEPVVESVPVAEKQTRGGKNAKRNQPTQKD